jgi:Na+/H+-dicarboxylate symporter
MLQITGYVMSISPLAVFGAMAAIVGVKGWAFWPPMACW